MIGNLQALETIKYLTQPEWMTWSSLHQFNGKSLSWSTMGIPKDHCCPVCQSPSDLQDVSRETHHKERESVSE